MTTYAHPEALVTARWLADHHDDANVRIVDVRYSLAGPLPEEYATGHIPGAVFCDLHNDTFDLGNEVPCRIAKPSRFEAAMSHLGIGTGTHVVAYDQEFGCWAARLWWALRYYGHDHVSLLDGGLRAWVAAEGPLEAGSVAVTPARFVAAVQPSLRASRDDVVTARYRRDVLVVDALPSKIYRGEVPMFPTIRGGHIPGARNVSAGRNVDHATGLLLSADELDAVWRQIGLAPEKQVITYCGAGDYGSFDLFALHLIGHDNGALYDGSWLEWGADPELPVEMGAAT